MNMKRILEIAVFDVQSALLAAEAGCDRIELCSGYMEGGVTISYGALKLVRERISIPVFPIIRPRGGNFFYSNEEFEVMKKDALLCKELGFDGVVIGSLNEDKTVDVKRTARLVELVYPLEVTFHRAFDRTKDAGKALEDIISCGCQRILTSGQKENALEGVGLIKQLVEQAEEKIIIMAGGGVRSSNVAEIAVETGTAEFHSSAKKESLQVNNLQTFKEEINEMRSILSAY